MAEFSLKKAEKIRESITAQQNKLIYDLYKDLYDDVTKQIKSMGKSESIQKTRLMMLQRDIKTNTTRINTEIEKGIRLSITDVSNAVVEDTREFLKQCGYEGVEGAFSYVPDNITRKIVTGQIYDGNWTLSNAIWGHTENFNSKLSYIITKGTAQGKSAFEIAKDLEQYVNPSKAVKSRVIDFQKYKRDNNGKIILDAKGNPITEGRKEKFYFGKVDYNAQRLARTMVSHAYQQSFELVNKNNPFVVDYIWRVAGQHGRTCQICMNRDGQHFKKDELPLDHPNGMCTFIANIPDSMNDISNKIAEWYNSPEGTFPELDLFASDF